MLRQVTKADLDYVAGDGGPVSKPDNLYVAEGPDGLEGWVKWCPQPFESEQLGNQSARIEAFGGKNFLSLLKQAYTLLASLEYDFISARVPVNWTNTTKALHSSGAREIERLLTFSRPLDGKTGPLPEGISIAGKGHAETCGMIGHASFTSDRFHQDPLIDDKRADSLKAAWMRNNCLGRADCVFLAQQNGEIVGANACLIRKNDAVIDLIGVLPGNQGKGWGRKLVEAAIAKYSGTAGNLIAGTQSNNTASVALYRSMGFEQVAEEATFHVHLRELM